MLREGTREAQAAAPSPSSPSAPVTPAPAPRSSRSREDEMKILGGDGRPGVGAAGPSRSAPETRVPQRGRVRERL